MSNFARHIDRYMAFSGRYATQLVYCFLLLVTLWGSLYNLLEDEYRQALKEIERSNDQLTRGLEEHVRRSLYSLDEYNAP